MGLKLDNAQSKAKQRCAIDVGMCLCAQLVQTKNKQCKSAIILQCYHLLLSDFSVSGVMADVLFYAASDYLHIFLT